jgi:7,8-dihydroneopterin aldolase/epimerase/oxygenase
VFTVFLNGLEFYGYHGVPAEERVLGHRYKVDLSLQVDGSAPEEDSIHGTVDYGELGIKVLGWATDVQAHTLERLAAILLGKIIEGYPLVQEATIRIAKPLPPAPLIAAEAGVEMTISR